MLHCVSERSLVGRQREPYFQSLILYNPNIHVDQLDRYGTKYLVNISPLKHGFKWMPWSALPKQYFVNTHLTPLLTHTALMNTGVLWQ